MKNKTLVLVDGNSLVYRAFFALPLLRTRSGIFTNAIYGFLTMLFRIIKDFQPEFLVVAFDKSRITRRTEEFAEYKAHRQPTPPELREQLPILKELLTAMDITCIEMEGYEADDLIGSLCHKARESGLSCLIMTGDQDALQLVGDGVEVLLTKKGISETELYNYETVLQKWEVSPRQLIDVKGLMGDPSDNIPGVPGIGKKTAVKLIKEFGSLDNLYEHLEEVNPPRIRELLKDNKEQAFMSRSLATIVTDIPVPSNWDDFRYERPQKSRLLELYQELEFNSFVKELGNLEVPVIEVKDLKEVVAKIKKGDIIALYLVVSQPHPMWGSLMEIYVWWQDQVFVISSRDVQLLKPVLENPDIPKYLHNAKHAQVVLERLGIRLDGIAGDTLLLSYVVDPGFQGESLKEHLFHYLGQVIDEAQSPEQAVAEIKGFHEFLMKKSDPEIVKLYSELELPLTKILGRMELAGIKVDASILSSLSREIGERLELIESEIYEMSGTEFNINSTRQLGQVLFEKLGLKSTKKTKTGYSTSIEVLEELYDQHPIIGLIMEYRQLAKLKSTYVDNLQQYIHPETGRVHTIFKQAITATGRLSSVEPNLQNIPVRMEEGRRIRKAFVAEGKDWLLLSADYSQIDLRVLAHVSGDPTLIETFRQGVDIHARTASEIFKVPLDKVNSELRRRAKAVNFGIVYGISEYGLSRDTGVSRSEAREYIEKYLNSYPGVKEYMQSIVEFGRQYGYVATVLGRRRYLPDLLSSNRMVRQNAERMALNTPIQGTSADIIKLAMLDVDRELKRWDLKSRMLLQVHDELVLEVPVQELDHVARLVKDCMENAFQLKVPLVASVKIGLNWYDMKAWEGNDA